MIIDKEIKIKISSNNYKYYKHLINNIKKDDEYIININQLHNGSHIEIKVECDICHSISEKPYREYLNSFNKRGIYCCSPTCAQFKNKKTNIEKYGCENVFQIKEIKEKIVKTNNEKYGVDWITQSDNFKEKSKITNIERYGYENAAQSDLIQNKMKKTCMEKYGVENATQNIEIFNKQKMSAYKFFKYKNIELNYQGTYELDFLNRYIDKLNIKNGMTIKYKNNRKNRIYYPDFYIPNLNLIVEIKSSYTYNKELEKNLKKQKACMKQGYNFIFIIDKNYIEFENFICEEKSSLIAFIPHSSISLEPTPAKVSVSSGI